MTVYNKIETDSHIENKLVVTSEERERKRGQDRARGLRDANYDVHYASLKNKDFLFQQLSKKNYLIFIKNSQQNTSVSAKICALKYCFCKILEAKRFYGQYVCNVVYCFALFEIITSRIQRCSAIKIPA